MSTMQITMPAGLRRTLRLEGVLELALAVVLYAHLGGSWPAFGLFFLAPDLALAAYLAGPRAGSIAYNAAHSYVGPVLFALAAVAVAPALATYALIWCAHIGFDRALGYGLKSRAGFGYTHLGLIGRATERHASGR